MYMVHTSARTGVDAIAAPRTRGFPVYGETLHQYLLYNAEDYKRPGGQIYHTYPSLKFPEDQAALWRAMRHGAIQCVATDEVCCPLEVELKDSHIDDVMGGNSGVEPRVSLMYTQMVRERRFNLEEFVALAQATPRRSWASIHARARSRLARTPTSCCSIRGDPDRYARRTCTSPITRPGKAGTQRCGRA